METVSKLAEVTRGPMVESVHRGVIVIVDIEGEIIYQLGDPQYETYLRSAAKPLQALPIIERGAADNFQLTLKELAVITGSHNGEIEHQEAVQGILTKIGLTGDNLLCGATKPIHRPTANKLVSEGKKPEAIHNPCSGKHAGMLALAVHEGYSVEDYYLAEHPVQQIMLQTVADLAQVNKEKIKIGIDGCGVPVFGLSVKAMAQAYANLAKPVNLSPQRQKACEVLQKAMSEYPLMVAGTGRFTTDLLAQMAPQVIAKDGTEAVYCLGIPEKGWGVAIKIEDGGARALNTIVLSVLEQLGYLPSHVKEKLEDYYYPVLKNFRGEEVGRIRPAFTLKR